MAEGFIMSEPLDAIITRLRDRCLNGWDWAYVEGSSLSEEDFREDLARVLKELERLQKGAAAGSE